MKYTVDYTSGFKKQHKKMYRDCEECHITPDWLLIYKVHDNNLILLLFATGSHSDLFK